MKMKERVREGNEIVSWELFRLGDLPKDFWHSDRALILIDDVHAEAQKKSILDKWVVELAFDNRKGGPWIPYYDKDGYRYSTIHTFPNMEAARFAAQTVIKDQPFKNKYWQVYANSYTDYRPTLCAMFDNYVGAWHYCHEHKEEAKAATPDLRILNKYGINANWNIYQSISFFNYYYTIQPVDVFQDCVDGKLINY